MIETTGEGSIMEEHSGRARWEGNKKEQHVSMWAWTVMFDIKNRKCKVEAALLVERNLFYVILVCILLRIL